MVIRQKRKESAYVGRIRSRPVPEMRKKNDPTISFAR